MNKTYMRLNSQALLALSFAAAAVILSSCSGGLQSSGPPQTASTSLGRTTLPTLERLTSVAVRPPVAIHRDARKSWISPDVNRTPRLFFVSDSGTNDVEIFTLPDFVPKGTITGFSEPQGMCSGTGGTVWVANTGTNQVMQPSHTGKLLNTIDDAFGYPVGCAVNAANGDLAVLNIFDFSGAGGAFVYSCPSCTPTELTIPDSYYYYYGAYDPNGDLFVDGANSSQSSTFGEIPSGSTTGHLITVKTSGGKIHSPAIVQWYKPGNYLVATGQVCNTKDANCLDWVKISGSKGTIIGQTDLENPSGGPICGRLTVVLDPRNEKNVVGVNVNTCGSGSSLDRWLYPAGGVPINSAEPNSLSEPLGGAISVK
ncbi:MAG: hypothetical protein WCB01_03930 [Candidatus Cybelea sp.]